MTTEADRPLPDTRCKPTRSLTAKGARGYTCRVSKSQLSPAQRRYLTSLGHHAQPLVTVGKEGVTEGVVAALQQALSDHELVKVKLGKSSSEERHDVPEQLASKAKAQFVSMIGKTMIIYKAHPEKPVIKLPRK